MTLSLKVIDGPQAPFVAAMILLARSVYKVGWFSQDQATTKKNL
jgi:hypothetical protein